MTAEKSAKLDQCVLVLARPVSNEKAVEEAVRQANLRAELCDGIDELCGKLNESAAAALLSSDHLSPRVITRLNEALSHAAPWSDLPLIVLCSAKPHDNGKPHPEDALAQSRDVILLQEPIETRTLVSVLRSVLRGRRRQYQIRELLEQQQGASERVASLVEQMDAFAYSISHDLRAPLRAIRGFAQALSEDYGNSLDATGREYLNRMEQGGERLDRLIQDLLQYSRLSRAPLDLVPISLETCVERVLQQLQEEIERSSSVIDISKPLPAVVADENVLQQVLNALFTNALKFVAPGVKPHIRLRATENGPSVRFWLADNGIGIAPAHQQRIFAVFERLHSAESYPGTGMGLAIVAKGVARLGGSVGLESAPGEGSRFWIELPRA